MKLDLDPMQQYYVQRAQREAMRRIEQDRAEKLNQMLTKLANGAKFCSLCGGEGHEAKDCKWNKNLV